MTGDRALERYRALVDGLAEAVSVWSDDGSLILANPAFWRMAGRDPAAGPLTLDWPGWRLLDHAGAPLPRERWPATVALREGRIVDDQTVGLERPGGDRVWLRVRAAPMAVGDDGRREAIVSLKDVTAERAAVEDARAAHDILRVLIDGIPYAIVLRDRSGRYLAANEAFCRWSGTTRDQVEGSMPAETLTPDWAEAAEVSRRRMEAVGETFSEEVTDASGTRAWRVVRTPYHDRSGALAGMVVMAVEITEHRALEAELLAVNAGLERRVRARTAELERAAAELEAFAYRVSHDLRAPLRSLQATAARLSADLGQAAPCVSEGLRRMEEGTDAMARLIGALLDLSHAGRRAVALETMTADLGVVAAEAVAEVAPAAEERCVVVDVADLPEWPCDPRLLRQALVNLLSNAVKFSRPGGGCVTVACARDDGDLVVTVSDDGIGFGPGEAQRLFTPFGRLANAADVEGTGIGLAIVHRIVTAHGGRIWATGEPGRGATFAFTLPRADG